MFISSAGLVTKGSCQRANRRGRRRQRTGEVHFAQDEISKDVGCLPEDTKRDHDASGGEEKEVEGAPEGHQHHGHHSCRLLPW